MKDNLIKRYLGIDKQSQIPIIIIAMIMGIYLLLHFFVFKVDPIQLFFYRLFDNYQVLIERISSIYLRIAWKSVTISNHTVYYQGIAYEAIGNGMLLKKWSVFTILVIWLLPGKTSPKVIFTVIFLAILLLTLPIGIAVNAYFNTYNDDLMAPYRIGKTIPLLAIVSFILVWINRNKTNLLKYINKFETIKEIIVRKKVSIIVVIYSLIILRTLITGYFAFEPWVNLIFNISQKALILLGYDAHVMPFYLYNNDVVIFMNKSCLGFLTMWVFASIIYLTGYHARTTWIYILSGVLFLNIVNILRFILLFIHIQKHGDYTLSVDIHDIYTGGIYIIVFLLWVLWFEKFADYKKSKKELLPPK